MAKDSNTQLIRIDSHLYDVLRMVAKAQGKTHVQVLRDSMQDYVYKTGAIERKN